MPPVIATIFQSNVPGQIALRIANTSVVVRKTQPNQIKNVFVRLIRS